MMHLMGYISLKDLNWKSRPYSAWPAYGQSKLANLLFTKELQRRLDAAGSPVKAHAAHPGYSATNLQGHSGRRVGDALMSIGNKLATDADFGARQTLYAAVAGPARQQLHRAPVRDARADRADPVPQLTGPQPEDRRRALGAVRAAHGHQICSLIWADPAARATLAGNHGEGGPATVIDANRFSGCALAVLSTRNRSDIRWPRTPPII